MFIDARRLPPETVVKAEVCVIGAGPAGLTIAKQLAGQPFQVCVLETGGFEKDDHIQALTGSEADTWGDRDYPRVDTMRRRQFGGTANAWSIEMEPNKPEGCRYVPLERWDFEQRDWVPYSGWPFNREYLDPFYERAQALCQLGSFTYEVEDWETSTRPRLQLPGDRFFTRMFQVSSRDVFLKDCKQIIEQADNITTYLYATAVELESNDTAGTVTGVRVACLGGEEFWVSAKMVILAMSGVENARILLQSNCTQSEGLGNQHDLVGRFLMDHPIVRSGIWYPSDPKIFYKMGLYAFHPIPDRHATVTGKLVLKPDVLQREQILSMNTAFFPCHGIYRFNLLRWLFPQGKRYKSPAVDAAIALKTALLRRKRIPKNFSHLVGQFFSGIDDIAYFLTRKGGPWTKLLPRRYGFDSSRWSELGNLEKRLALFEIVHLTEQAPNPENRVMLGTEMDSIGCRKVQLQWRWHDLDKRSILRTQELLMEELAKAGLGCFKPELDRGEPQPIRLSAHHNLGTTRMHADPKQGVVDANCQVHGVSNLFIAGGSVFPTGSYANPTLTIIALAIRLADHIKNTMSQPNG